MLKPGDTLAVGSTVMHVEACEEEEVAAAVAEVVSARFWWSMHTHVVHIRSLTHAHAHSQDKPHDAPASDMFLVFKGVKYFLPKQVCTHRYRAPSANLPYICSRHTLHACRPSASVAYRATK